MELTRYMDAVERVLRENALESTSVKAKSRAEEIERWKERIRRSEYQPDCRLIAERLIGDLAAR